jgi:hypothetical protein
MGMCPSPTLWWNMPHFSSCWKPSPLQAHWGRRHHSCLLWPACLFTVHVRECPSPIPRNSGCPTLFVFFFQLLINQFGFFSFFPGWVSVCPESYANLFQGCLWEYCMPLSSPGGLLLPSKLGTGIWWCRSPPGFSI